MKTTNILYWTFTGIFGAFMLFSGIMDAMVGPDQVALVSKQLGYPEYIIPFLGTAKILGVIAIVVPGFPRIKEWAYAGLFFDLLGATYSALQVGGFVPPMLFMVLPFSFLFLSYTFYHKRASLRGEAHVTATA
jgi:hypothetical protein